MPKFTEECRAQNTCRVNGALISLFYTGQVLEENVISTHHVDSWFECSDKCLESENCVSFSHRTTSSNDTNCITASELGEIVIKNHHEVDTWTTYEIQETGSVSS